MTSKKKDQSIPVRKSKRDSSSVENDSPEINSDMENPTCQKVSEKSMETDTELASSGNNNEKPRKKSKRKISKASEDISSSTGGENSPIPIKKRNTSKLEEELSDDEPDVSNDQNLTDSKDFKLRNKNLMDAMKMKSTNVLSMIQSLLKEVAIAKENGSDREIMSDLIASSNLGLDILDYVDHISGGKPTDAQKALLFHLMELVLLHLSLHHPSDEKNPSIFIVKRILLSHSELLKKSLYNAVKSSHIKPVFKLLIAMVTVSPSEVISSFNIPNALIMKHLKNRDARDSQDVRTCIIHFILSFLMFGDATVIRQLCEKKDLLRCPFPGLKDDKASLIELFLKTLLEKIVRNPGILKTAKVQIFFGQCLKLVIDLFEWSGPKKYSKKAKYSKNESKGTETLVSSQEEIAIVHSAVQEFLTELLSSHKNGIIFKRVSNKSGLKNDNPNHMVTELLKSLKNPFETSYKSQFVASVLSACPEQISYFYPNIKHSFEPRDSPVWFSAMELLIKVASCFDLRDTIANSANGQFDKYLGKNILLQLGFSMFSKGDLVNALKIDSLQVRITILKYLMLVLSKIKEIGAQLESEVTVVINSKNLVEVLTTSVLNVLPSPVIIFPDILNEKEPQDKNELKNTLDWVMNSVKVLALISEIFPNGTDLNTIPIAALLAVLKSQDDKPQIESVLEIKISILKLLVNRVEVDSSLLENPKESNIVYLLLKNIVKHDTDDCKFETQLLELVKNFLGDNEVILDSLNELKVWIMVLKNQKSKIILVALEFLWKAALTLLTNPSIYVDKCIALQTHSENSIITDNFEENRLLFSPLVPAALDLLKETKALPAAINYLEDVLEEILHQSVEPKLLCSFVMKYERYLSESIKEYVSFWLPESKIFKKVTKNYQLPESTTLAKENLRVAFKVLRCERKSFLDVSEQFLNCDFKLKKSISLVNQILLYLQTELDGVLAYGGDCIGIQWLLNFLDELLRAIDFKKESHPNIVSLSQVHDKIFGHPTMLKMFMIIDRENSIVSKEINRAVKLVTKFLSNHLKLAVGKLRDSVISMYKSKCLSFIALLSRNSLEIENDDSETFKNFRVSVSALSDYFSANELVIAINLLSQWSNVKDHHGIKVICSLLMNFLRVMENKSQELGFEVVNNIFNILLKADIEYKYTQKLAALILQLLEAHPRYCFAVDTDSSMLMVANPNIISIKIVLFLMQQIPAHHSALCHWLEDNSGTLMLWPLPLIVQLANILYNGYHDSTKALSHINKIFLLTINTVVLNTRLDHETLWINHNILPILQTMMKNNILPLKSLMKLAQNIYDKCDNVAPSLVKCSMSIQVFKCLINHQQSSDAGIEEMLIKVVFSWLDIVVKEKKMNNYDLKLYFNEAKTCFQELSDTSMQSSIATIKSWSNFLNHSLEMMETGSREIDTHISNLELILCVCKKLYLFNAEEKANTSNPTAYEVFQMFITNSNSLAILREEQKEGQNLNHIIDLKSLILDIILFLVMNDTSIYDASHFQLYLECYRGTLRTVDQKMLCLMKLYETHNISMAKYSPYFWGKAASDHYSQLTDKPNKIIEPKLDDILNILRRDVVMHTTLHFPLELELSPVKFNSKGHPEWIMSCTENPEWKNFARRMYDPRFILPLLSNLMEPGNVVNCSRFIYANCLVLCLSGLSSTSDEMRMVSYSILAKFYSHLESAYAYKDKTVYKTLLEHLVYSIKQKNKKLPSITANFYVRACAILGKPYDSMYQLTYEYLLKSRTLELDCVPNFYRMFYGKDAEHEEHRRWIINVIKDGFKTNLDFHLCQKAFVFNAILTYAESSISSLTNKIWVVELLRIVVRNRASAFSLYRDHNILAWIISVLEKEPDITLSTGFVKVLNQLWLTSLETPKVMKTDMQNDKNEISQLDSKKHPFNVSFPMDFIVTQLSILSFIGQRLDVEVQLMYLETLSDVLHYVLKSDFKEVILLRNVHIEQLANVAWNLENNILKPQNDYTVTQTLQNDALKCAKLALNIVALVSPKITMNKALFGEIFIKMIEHESTELPNMMKWLRNSLEKNPEVAIEAVMERNVANSGWLGVICDRLVKYFAISNEEKKVRLKDMVELLNDMIYVGQNLFAQESLSSPKKNMFNAIKQEDFDPNTLSENLTLTLKLWSLPKTMIE